MSMKARSFGWLWVRLGKYRYRPELSGTNGCSTDSRRPLAVVGHLEVAGVGQPLSAPRHGDQQVPIVDHQRTLDADGEIPPIAPELPAMGRARGEEAKADALVPGQFFRGLRPAGPGEIVRGAHHRPLQVRGQAHGDHVLFDRLAQADTGIEALADQVDRGIVQGNLQPDVGIGRAIARDQGFDQQLAGQPWRGQAQGAHRLVAIAAQHRQGVADFTGGRAQADEQAAAGFRQGHAAGGALEQQHPGTPLQGLYRMAHGSRGHPQLAGGEGEALVFGDGEKLGQAVERVLVHCKAIMKDTFIVLVARSHFSHQCSCVPCAHPLLTRY